MPDRIGRKEEGTLIALAQSGDRGAVERVISAYIPLIRAAAKRFFVFSGAFSREELVQSGVLGLMKAIRRYAHDEGAGLGTYAMPWILGEMRMTIRCASESTKAYSLRRRIDRERERLYAKTGREPTIGELANACLLSETEIAEIISLSMPVSESILGEEGASLYDQISLSEGNEPDEAEIHIALDALAQDERLLIMLRYFRDMTQCEAAATLGKSQAQISRIERRALDHLKRLLE